MTTENTGTPPGAAPGAAPAGTQPGAAPIDSGFTLEQTEKMANWLVEGGHLTQSQMIDAFATSIDQSHPEAGQDVAGAAPREVRDFLTKQGAHVPTKPTDYGRLEHAGEYDPKADLALRQAFAAGAVPPAAGRAIAEAAAKVAPQWGKMNEVQREIYGREQLAIATRALGPKAAELIALGKDLIANIESRRPGFVKWIEDSGVGSSATFIQQIAHHAALLAKRPEKRK